MRKIINCLGLVTLLAALGCDASTVGGSPTDPTAASCNHLWACGKPSLGMASPQNPSATPTFPTTIAPPANGDPLDAQQLNLDVETPIQNGVEAARLLLRGGGLKRRVRCTGNTSMVIQPLGAVMASVGGVWSVVAHTVATTIDPSALVALAPNTRYWVYAKLSAGPSLSFIINTIAPDIGLSYQQSDESALLISTFSTLGANIRPYVQNGNQYKYSDIGTGVILNAGSAMVLTDVPFGVTVPISGWTQVQLAARWQSTVAGQINVTMNSTAICADLEATSTNFISTTFCPVANDDDSNNVKYQVNNAAIKLSLFVSEFIYG